MKKLVLATVISALFALSGCGNGVKSIDDANKFVVGTWVYDENTSESDKYPQWERLEVHSDGTVIQQKAYPSDNQWGEPESKKYKIISKKYSNNGEKYFALSMDEYSDNEPYIIDGNDLIKRLVGSSFNAKFRRGDRDLNN